MSKVYLKELNKLLKDCKIGCDWEEIANTPCFAVHHSHKWDHGYDAIYGYNGTRREFYADMKEMCEFLFEYFCIQKVHNLIIAPCHQYNQFSFNAEKNDIYDEIYNFLRENKVRKNERSGIIVNLEQHERQVEMVLEGAFRGISELCLFAVERKVLIVPDHHFGISFYSHNIREEKSVICKMLSDFSSLCYFERPAQ